jgi:hypothetical protein
MRRRFSEKKLETLQRLTFDYFLKETNPRNGLVLDSTRRDAPEIVLPSIQHFDETYPEMTGKYGFKCSFNPTFSGGSDKGWISKGYYGLDQGPMVLMIENHRSGLLWKLMKNCRYIVEGLRRAGFKGGWLRD